MRFITIQDDIEVLHPLTRAAFLGPDGKPLAAVSHRSWIMEFVLSDQRMGLTPVLLVRMIALVEKFTKCEPGDVVTIDDEDHKRMKEIVEAPNATYSNPLLAMQLVKFAQAILDAPNVPPVIAAPSATE